MLCNIIKRQSIFTWTTLMEANALSCKVNEESFTDFLILELAKNASLGGYSVRAFNKRQEAINGADWEIWFTGPSKKWFGYRIQAKVINVSNQRYSHLYHKGLSQAAKLISEATSVGAVPIYVLYSAWLKTSGAPLWKCGTYTEDNRLWGMTAVSAHNISTKTPKNDLTSLSKYMHTFHCLFCCGGYGGHDLPTRAYSFATKNIDSEANLHDATPAHLRRLLELESTPDMQHEDSVDVLPENVSRIIVIGQNE